LLFETLFSDPGMFLRLLLFRVPALLLTLTFHEWAHAFVANRCGDPTARLMGRMTMNPLRHLDPVGTLLMFTAGFGWAKPVPVNPLNYRRRVADEIKVSLAGIVTNLLLFMFFTAAMVALNSFLWKPEVIFFSGGPKAFLDLFGINFGLVYGHNIGEAYMQRTWLAPVMALLAVAAQMNLMVAIFNLLPFPPLDGYHVANNVIFRGRFHITPQMAQMGMMAVIALSIFTNILSDVMIFLASNVHGAVLSIFLMLTGN